MKSAFLIVVLLLPIAELSAGCNARDSIPAGHPLSDHNTGAINDQPRDLLNAGNAREQGLQQAGVAAKPSPSPSAARR